MLMKNKVKIIFFGTPEFAVPTLKALHQEGYNVCLVVTQPDKPAGRKNTLIPPPVKVEAKELGLEICQRFEDLKTFGPSSGRGLKTKNSLRLRSGQVKLDLGIVAAYGEIIPKKILDLFPLGCLNLHPSLLPKYRGPSPIQAAILNGDKETGVTIIKLDEKMDHGNHVARSTYHIAGSDTYESLLVKLAEEGAKLLIKILPDYLSGKIKLVPQDDSQATFTRLLKREDGKIDWQKSAEEIERQIRAYYPWPGSYTKLKTKNLKLKILSATAVEDLSSAPIGEFHIKNGQLIVRCGQGSLIIEKLQPEGKKEMTAKEFINGYLK